MTNSRSDSNTLSRHNLRLSLTRSDGSRPVSLDRAASDLVEQAGKHELRLEEYVRMQELLGSVWLPSGRTFDAGRHLENALRYAYAGLFGPARLELLLLRGLLVAY